MLNGFVFFCVTVLLYRTITMGGKTPACDIKFLKRVNRNVPFHSVKGSVHSIVLFFIISFFQWLFAFLQPFCTSALIPFSVAAALHAWRHRRQQLVAGLIANLAGGNQPVHFKSQMFKFEIPSPVWGSAFRRSGRRAPKPCPNRLKPELQTQAGMNCI